MRDDEPFDYGRLTEYVSGECRPDGVVAVEVWMSAAPSRRALVEYLRRARALLTPLGDAEAAQDATDQIVHTVMAKITSSPAPVASRTHDSKQDVPPRPHRTVRRHQGIVVGQTLRRIVSTVVDRLAGSAMAALFGRKVTTLTAAELERLRGLVEHAKLEDE